MGPAGLIKTTGQAARRATREATGWSSLVSWMNTDRMKMHHRMQGAPSKWRRSCCRCRTRNPPGDAQQQRCPASRTWGACTRRRARTTRRVVQGGQGSCARAPPPLGRGPLRKPHSAPSQISARPWRAHGRRQLSIPVHSRASADDEPRRAPLRPASCARQAAPYTQGCGLGPGHAAVGAAYIGPGIAKRQED